MTKNLLLLRSEPKTELRFRISRFGQASSRG